jgi:hypothetical protein
MPGNPNAAFIRGIRKSIGKKLQIMSLHGYDSLKKKSSPNY